jgi:hypothetical protein
MSAVAFEKPERPETAIEPNSASKSDTAGTEAAVSAADQAGNEKPEDLDALDAMGQIHHGMNAAPPQSGQSAPTGVTTSRHEESDVTTTVEPAGPVVLDALDADLTEAEEPVLRQEDDAVPLRDDISEHGMSMLSFLLPRRVTDRNLREQPDQLKNQALTQQK